MTDTVLNEAAHGAYFEALMKSDFGTVAEAQKQPNFAGVYAFFDQEAAVYVGRTAKRGLGGRMKNHLARAHNQAVLAYKLAKRELEYKTEYSGPGTRSARMKEQTFLDAFERKRAYISQLRVKFVAIDDPDHQYVFEFYASKRLRSPNNDFNTH